MNAKRAKQIRRLHNNLAVAHGIANETQETIYPRAYTITRIVEGLPQLKKVKVEHVTRRNPFRASYRAMKKDYTRGEPMTRSLVLA